MHQELHALALPRDFCDEKSFCMISDCLDGIDGNISKILKGLCIVDQNGLFADQINRVIFISTENYLLENISQKLAQNCKEKQQSVLLKYVISFFYTHSCWQNSV